MSLSADDDDEVFAAFLEGHLPLEAAARALRGGGARFVGIRGAKDLTAAPEIVAAQTPLRALITRVAELNADEALLERAAHVPRIAMVAPPADPSHFCCSVEVVITGRDRRRAYRASVRLYLCTPSWLDALVREHGPTWTPAPLIIRRWHAAHVHAAIVTRIASTPADTWTELVAQLSRIMEPEA